MLAQKVQRTLEIAGDLPARMASLMDATLTGDFSAQEMSKLLTDVYVYGSLESAKLVVDFQKHNYALTAKEKPENADTTKSLAYLALLIAQLKFDMTGLVVPAKGWLEMKLKDYDVMESVLLESIEEIVRSLGLNSKFC